MKQFFIHACDVAAAGFASLLVGIGAAWIMFASAAAYYYVTVGF